MLIFPTLRLKYFSGMWQLILSKVQEILSGYFFLSLIIFCMIFKMQLKHNISVRFYKQFRIVCPYLKEDNFCVFYLQQCILLHPWALMYSLSYHLSSQEFTAWYYKVQKKNIAYKTSSSDAKLIIHISLEKVKNRRSRQNRIIR